MLVVRLLSCLFMVWEFSFLFSIFSNYYYIYINTFFFFFGGGGVGGSLLGSLNPEPRTVLPYG